MVAAAAVSVWRAAVWPALGARYERRPATAASGATARRPDLLWDALDRGEDPTAWGPPPPRLARGVALCLNLIGELRHTPASSPRPLGLASAQWHPERESLG